MHHQLYDSEEEFEPRITPKPITKFNCFAVPTIPEISLIFEKPIAQNLNDGSPSSPARSVKPVQVSDTLECTNSTSPILHNSNSYAAWREQNYSREINSESTTYMLPSCKNTCSYNHISQSGLQDISIQKQEGQAKVCGLQERVINARANERIYEKSVKFRSPNVEDSYDLEEKTRLLSSNKRHLSCNSLQRATCIITDHTAKVPSNTVSNTLNKTEHFQVPHNGYQQCHTPNCNTDNNETVKTLLQLVNTQSEQIKNLQLQVDRLVRMQEENFRNKSTYTCSLPLANQEFRYPSRNCCDAALSSSLAQYQNQGIKKNVDSQSISVTEKKDLENFGENNKLETALLEQQSKKAFMEQKVSIGVMTSFEFTVQNSPFVIDSEIYEKKEAQQNNNRENNNINRRNAVNIHETTESLKRYKNTFTCKPGAAQLENIVEDSESYLSSSQQQSSNFNTSSSVKDLERHTPKQTDLYNTANTSESSKMYQHFPTNLNQAEIHEEAYIRKDGNIDEVENTKKMSNTSMDVACSPTESTNKALITSDTNDYAMIDGEKSIDKMNTNKHSLHNIYLPAMDYYHKHRNKEYGINGKQIKEVDDSMTLSGGDLKILERPPPTPEPSIHVEMQEYTSDDESDKLKHTSKIGWTFYNNVLGQVNEILQNSSVIDDKNQDNTKISRKIEQENNTENRTALNTIKAATLEQLRKLGISLTENNEHKESNGNQKTLDSSFYPRLDYQANMIHTTSIVNETNTSMHMKALALKYLSDDQLADIALHTQESSSLKHLMVSNMQGTNMSLATMRYLERYQLLPGKNNIQTEDTDQMYSEIASKYDFKSTTAKNNPALRRFPFVQTPRTSCPSRILDLSTLKRQPKLL